MINSEKYLRCLLRFKYPYWCLIAIALACSVYAATSLTVSADNRVFYSENNQHFNDLLDFEAKYLPSNNILLVVARSENTKFDRLADAIRWLNDEAWGITNTIRVDSLASYPKASTLGDDITVRDFLEHYCDDSVRCANTVVSFNDPAIVNRLISSDGNTAAVVLTLNLQLGDTHEIQLITSEVRQLGIRFSDEFPDIEFRFTGGIPMMNAFSEAAEKDSSTLVTLAFIVMTAALAALLGGITVSLLITSVSLSAAIVTMGVAGSFGLVINTATSIAPIVIFTIQTAASVHYVVTFFQSLSQSGSRTDAAVQALDLTTKPILLTAFTSMLGFLSMAFADAPPLGELGALASVGIASGTLLVLTAIPLFLVSTKVVPSRVRKLRLDVAKSVFNRGALLTLAAVSIVVLAGVSKLEVEDDFVGYFSETYEFRKHTDFAEERLAGPNHIELDLVSKQPGGIFHPSYQQALASLVELLRSKPTVANVLSVQDVIGDVASAFNLGKSVDSLSADELAQMFLAYTLSLQYGQSVSDLASPDNQSSRVSILLGGTTSTQIQSLYYELNEWSADWNTEVELTVTGENIPVAFLTGTNFRSLSVGIAGTLALTALIVAWSLKRSLLVLVALAATVLPILLGFGIWGWVFTQIGLAAVVVVAMTIGIIIDDAIHLLSRYASKARRYDNATAVSDMISEVGPAVLTTSWVLVSGFLILSLSGFGINAALGLCTVFVVLCALFVDLLILPGVLAKQQ